MLTPTFGVWSSGPQVLWVLLLDIEITTTTLVCVASRALYYALNSSRNAPAQHDCVQAIIPARGTGKPSGPQEPILIPDNI